MDYVNIMREFSLRCHSQIAFPTGSEVFPCHTRVEASTEHVIIHHVYTSSRDTQSAGKSCRSAYLTAHRSKKSEGKYNVIAVDFA
ncbi:hypothetical protein T01_12978 [Trichinella spiralis]|uniref:Uncharacterized protein n=1 Tax=Trichinella spiralis TaxID=6334 RepID=A0A0V1BGI8_TRISP|nr:hypothetical protein T01_12978 [Trichinella spiralis]